MCEAQIDRERQDVHAERCTRLQARAPVPGSPGRSTDNARHIAPPECTTGRTGGRSTLSVQIVQHLIGIGQRSSAMHTAQRLGHDCRIGVAGQRPAATLPAQATLARAVALPFLRLIGLLSLRRRQCSNCSVSSAARRASPPTRRCGALPLKPLPQRQDQRFPLRRGSVE